MVSSDRNEYLFKNNILEIFLNQPHQCNNLQNLPLPLFENQTHVYSPFYLLYFFWDYLRKTKIGEGLSVSFAGCLGMLVSPVQSSCAQYFKRPIFKTSEFGVKKGLLINRVPTEKMGAPLIPQIHLKEAQSSGFFYIKGRGSGKGDGWLTITGVWAPAVFRGRPASL